MGITSKNQRLISYKKLLGKSHSSAQKGDATEEYVSSVQLGTSIIFGEEIPATPPDPNGDGFNDLIVKQVTFDLEPISESQYKAEPTKDEGENDNGLTQQSNIHAWRLKLPTGYSDTQDKFAEENYVSDNNKLQLVPPTYGDGYRIRIYSDQNLTQEMFASGQQEWILDYFSGILFVQDVFSTIPLKAVGYVYTGKYLDETVQEAASTGGSSYWVQLNPTDITTANNVQIGGSTGNNFSHISFGLPYNDQSYIGNRVWYWAGGTSPLVNTELLLAKGNNTSYAYDIDRIRLAAPNILFDTTSQSLSSTVGFENLATSTLFETRIIIREDGKVGIGTLTPTELLDVNGNANISEYLKVRKRIFALNEDNGTNGTNLTIRKDANPSGTNLEFNFSHRSNGQELLLYAYNGSNSDAKFVTFYGAGSTSRTVSFPSVGAEVFKVDLINYETRTNGAAYIYPPSTKAAMYLERASSHPTIKSLDSWMIIDSAGSATALNYFVSDNVILANGGGKVGVANTAPGELLDVRTSAVTAGQGARIGEAKIGTWEGSTSWAAFTHNSVHATSNSYALMQNNTGRTLLNAAENEKIEFRINNGTTATVQSNRIEIGSHTDTSLRDYYNEWYESTHTSQTLLPIAGSDSSITSISNYGLYVKGSAFIEEITHLDEMRTRKSVVSGPSFIHDGFLQIKQNLRNDNGGYSPRGLTLVSPNECWYEAWKIYLSDSTNNGRNGESLSFYYVGPTYQGSENPVGCPDSPSGGPGVSNPPTVHTGLRGYINSDATSLSLNFTGQHRNQSETIDLNKKEECLGFIVVSDGTYASFNANSITINEALPKVSLASKRNQKSVFGVVSDAEDETAETREYALGNFVSVSNKTVEDTRLVINSIGEGGIWITNVNGNLENGDYITTCEIPGYGMKQDDDLLHNYTVAKITCDCDFNLESPIYICEEFEHEGTMYKRAFVGCTYHCG